MKEGLGSYKTTVSDGWLTEGLQSITATQYPILLAHSPSNSAAGMLKTVQILSCGYKQTFLLILRWLSCIVFLYKGISWAFLDLVLILLTGEKLFFLFVFFAGFILTTVFPSLVNDREDASYLIVLFYLLKYWSRIAVVKLTKRGIYDFPFGCHLMCKYEKTVYVFPWQY